MKGVPIRIEIGPRDVDNNQVVVFRRDTGEKVTVNLDKLSTVTNEIKKTFTENLKKAADKIFKEKCITANTKDEIKAGLDKGFMIRTSFCSIDKDGEACAIIAEKELGGEVRGEWFEKNEKVFCDCPICGKKSNHVVYIAKSH
jgi:prolyl-tRNA synthetase